MVESIARVEWIQRNIFNLGGSSTGSEGIHKHLKRQKGEGVETENICNVAGRAAMTVEQRGLERTTNVQVSTSAGDLVCVVIHLLT